jgi:hypothetical protein
MDEWSTFRDGHTLNTRRAENSSEHGNLMKARRSRLVHTARGTETAGGVE